MKEGFRWCPFCGKPHGLADRVCTETGKALEVMLHRSQRPSGSLPAVPSLVGTTLGGRYQILRQIGAGGMGIVFEAQDLVLNTLVAIKVVIKQDSPEALARLALEARFVAACHHPNICNVLDVGQRPDGGPYIVLERLFGDTLATHMKSWRVKPVREVVNIFLQTLSGLDAAHRAHIVHRDLKPQNIFLANRTAPGPLVKILDFGFARDLSTLVSQRITQAGKACGTAQYMSPEQLGVQELDFRSDLFAVGVMMYEILTGRHPFAGASQLDVQVRILREDPPPLRKYRPDVSPEVEQIVAKAMSKDRNYRPSSAADMHQALSEAMMRLAAEEELEDELEPVSMTEPIWLPPTSSPLP